MAAIIRTSYLELSTITQPGFETSFRRDHFVRNDASLCQRLERHYPFDHAEFLACFLKLQHFPDFPHVDEGIETCLVDLSRKTIEQAPAETGQGYVAQGTLNGLPCQNRFLKHLILQICEPLAFHGSRLHVGVKFHRRQIAQGDEGGHKGLGPHQDYDSEIIVMMKIEQKNMSGGRNQITDSSRNVLLEDSMADPGSFVYVDNTQLFHELTPMRLQDPSRSGHRDVMILEIKRVPARRGCCAVL